MAPTTKRSHDQTVRQSASFDPEEVADNTRQAVKRRRVGGPSEGKRGIVARRGQVSASGLPDGDREAVVAGKGVRYNLPPMSEFPEMMEDMVARAMVDPRFLGAIKALGTYKIPIATMCSGSEAPLLACLELCRGINPDPFLA